MHPLALWNAGNDQSICDASACPSSVFGALPYPSATLPLPDAVTFKFAFSGSTILNCHVIGPQNDIYFRVSTDAGYTVLKDTHDSNIALLEWQDRPTLQMWDLVPKQPIGQWLRLSEDRSYRLMVHNSVGYSWSPKDKFLRLSIRGSDEVLVRLSKTHHAAVLELTHHAIHRGLLERAVLAAIILLSGKSID